MNSRGEWIELSVVGDVCVVGRSALFSKVMDLKKEAFTLLRKLCDHFMEDWIFSE